MNLFADESVDRPLVEALRRQGHIVEYVADLAPGISDDEVLQQANARGVPLLTADKDFGELVFRLARVHSGVILLRIAGLSVADKIALVCEAFRDRNAEFPGAFSVITPSAVRIRRTV
jgi:predicted nuclease of predicted toxin-antitoxin system